MKQIKRTKEFVKNTLVTGIGLGVGVSALSKISSGMPKGTEQMGQNGLSAFNIASSAMTIGGAKYAMDSLDMLTQKKKKR